MNKQHHESKQAELPDSKECRAVFFKRGFAEPEVSASGCQGYHRNRPKLPGTKFATTDLRGFNNTSVSQYSCHCESHWKFCLYSTKI